MRHSGKRVLAFLLCVLMAVSLLPAPTLAEGEGLSISTGYQDWSMTQLVAGGVRTAAALPEGVSYLSDSHTLVLHNASLGMLWVRGGSLTIRLEGQNRLCGSDGLRLEDGSYAVEGSGSLELDCSTGFRCVSCSLTLRGGSFSLGAPWDYRYEFFSLDRATATVCGSASVCAYTDHDSLTLSEIHVAGGSVEYHLLSSVMLGEQSRFRVSGGTVRIETEPGMPPVSIWDESSLSLEGGDVYLGGNVPLQGGSLFRVSGGTVSIAGHVNIWSDSSFVLSGGTVSIADGIGVWDNSSFVMDGGSAILDSDDWGVSCWNNSTFSCRGGQLRLGTAEKPLEGGILCWDGSSGTVSGSADLTVYSQNVALHAWNNGSQRVSGGSLHLDTLGASLYAGGGDFEVTGGELWLNNAYSDGGTMRISGGTLHFLDREDAMSGGWAMGVSNGALLELSGGDFDVATRYGITASSDGTLRLLEGAKLDLALEQTVMGVYESGRLELRGGSLSLSSAEGDAISIRDSSLSILAGTLTARGGSVGLRDEQGFVRVLGGTLRLMGGDSALSVTSYGASPITVGKGMRLTDNETGEELRLNARNGSYWCPSRDLTVSGGGYSAALSLPNGSPVLGSAFSVSADIVPGQETCSAVFTVPAGLELVEGSVTLDGAPAVYTRLGEDRFRVELDAPAFLRFRLLAKAVGTYTLRAEVLGDGKQHSEALGIQVSAFTLSLPTRVARTTIPLSGTAAPGSTVRFFENGSLLTETRPNALGGWSAALSISPAEGKRTITAEIRLPDGTVLSSPVYPVTYSPNGVAVRTLTVSNTVHADQSSELVENKLEINYLEGTKSSGFYTYMPGYPTFRFRVDFENEGSGELGYVAVVTRDRLGGETLVPLSRQADGVWAGEYDYDDQTLPYSFQVEWSDEAVNSSAAESWPTESVEPAPALALSLPEAAAPAAAGETEEEDDDELLIVAGPDFRFAVTAPGVHSAAELGDCLTLTDSAENPVSFTADYSDETGAWSVQGDYTRSQLYIARVHNGASFSDYPGEPVLNLLIRGAEPVYGGYTYCENVVTVPDLSSAERVPNTVLLCQNDWSSWYVEADGSLSEAGLLDVYEDLSITEQSIDVSSEPIYDDFLDSLRSAVLQSDTYQTALRSMELLAEDANLSDPLLDSLASSGVVLPGPGDVTIKLAFRELPSLSRNPDGSALLRFSVAVTFEKELVSEDGKNVVLSLELSSNVKKSIYTEYRLIENGTERNYFAVDSTETYALDFRVTVNNEQSTELGDKLKEYFQDEDMKRVLVPTALEHGNVREAKKIPVDFIRPIYLPTNIPGVFITLRMDFGFDFKASGEGIYTFQQTFHHMDGIRFNGFGVPSFLHTEYQDRPSGELSIHLTAQLMPYVRFHAGLSVLKCLDLTFYFQVGLEGVLHGHVTTDFSRDGTELELYFAENVVLEAGGAVRVRLLHSLPGDVDLQAFLDGPGLSERNRYRLKKIIGVLDGLESDYTIPMFEHRIPLFQIGMELMPTYFTVEEDEIAVYGSCDLTHLVDLSLSCLSFSSAAYGSRADFPVKSKTMAPEHYSFTFGEEPPQGVLMSEQGELTLPEDLPIGTTIPVQVWYQGSSEDYRLMKTVVLRYEKAGFTIQKIVSDGKVPPVARFTVMDMNTGRPVGSGYTTTPGGTVVVYVPDPDHSYYVTEVGCPANYRPEQNGKIVTVRTDELVTVTFTNIPVPEEPEKTEEVEDTPIRDPSGYVYEGSPEFRVEGVRATLYYSDSREKPTRNAEEAQRWDAAAFGQANPLTTDALGQYKWMVPDGWWQVKYEKEGYLTVYSDWMPVPPEQTEVNVEMISDQSARYTVETVEDGAALIRANHPVVVSSVKSSQVLLLAGGRLLRGGLFPVNAAWTDDGRVCATLFSFLSEELDPGLRPEDVRLYVSDAVTTAGVFSGNLTSYEICAAILVKGGVQVTAFHADGLRFQQLVAVYDAKGRMIDCRPGTPEDGEVTSFYPMNTAGAAKIRVFTLDVDSGAPLWEPFEAAVSPPSP